MTQPALDNRRSPVTRPELATVLALVLLGFALRAWHPARMAVEHFDEGVYASNVYCGPVINPEAPYSYPDRHLYAPPLLPALLEALMLIGGNVMWVNVVVGTLTVLAVWCVARDWFGPVAGVIACALAAASEYHVAFSRTALTDPLLCLWLLTAVYAGGQAVLTRGPFWIALAGGCAGLAWCTKYNGWLALAITGSGTLAWLLFSRQSLKTAAVSLAVWTLTALIAGAIFWGVVLRELAAHGGYAAVAANHATYLVGPGGWWNSFLHQSAAHRQLDGWITLVGLACVFLLGSLVSARRFTWNGLRSAPDRPHATAFILIPLMILVAGVIAGSSLVLGAGALLGFLVAIRTPERIGATPAEDVAAVQLAGWMSAAWFLGLLVAVPLYHPYPRLSLPLLVPCWMLAASGLSSVIRSTSVVRTAEAPLRPGGLAAIAVLLTCVAVLSAGKRGAPPWPGRFAAWEDRTELRDVARQVLADTQRTVGSLPPSKKPGFDAVFYVYGEPALFFHLESLAGETSLEFISQPAGNLDVTRPGATDPGVATFLVTGMHSREDSPEFLEATRGLESIAVYDYRPSLLVRLDDAAGAEQPARVERVRLFLVHPPH